MPWPGQRSRRPERAKAPFSALRRMVAYGGMRCTKQLLGPGSPEVLLLHKAGYKIIRTNYKPLIHGAAGPFGRLNPTELYNHSHFICCPTQLWMSTVLQFETGLSTKRHHHLLHPSSRTCPLPHLDDQKYPEIAQT